MDEPEPGHPAPRTLGSLSGELADSNKAVRALWRAADDGIAPTTDSRSEAVLCQVLRAESRILRHLLTENAVIRHAPFREFASALARELDTNASNGWLSSASGVSRVCRDYRRTRSNFLPLRDHCYALQNGWGKFLFCRAPREEQDFFIFASGDTRTAIVHFDQWLRRDANREEVTGQYGRRLNSFLAEGPATIVLVKKELGPTGPEAIWDRLAPGVGQKHGVYRYNQNADQGVFERRPSEETGRYVVLYDLVYTGEGIQAIDQHLRKTTPAESIRHIVLYDYFLSPSRASARPDIEVIYDARRYSDLAREHFEAPSSRETRVAQTGVGVFERAQLEASDARATPMSSDVSMALGSGEFAARYGGRWVALNEGAVIRCGQSYEDVVARPGDDAGLLGSVAMFVPPVLTGRTYVP